MSSNIIIAQLYELDLNI